MAKKSITRDMGKKCENCWDFKNCADEKKKFCMAFRSDMGKECWFIASLTEKVRNVNKYGKCFQCEWYKKFND